jgi:alanyl-tRNA synthetase
MTNRLYYTDAYRTEFSSAVSERASDGTRVYLDETAFYPTSGGQPHDIGTLGGTRVIDVVDEGERIAHVLAAPLADHDDMRVSGRVDWARRFDHMQQHTGQHLVSAVFEDLFGAKTVSVHFGPEYSTLDLDAETITRDQMVAAEARANELVADARAVNVTFEDSESAIGLRKPSDRPGLLRIVSIAEVDRSACGGTHVRSTAEIGAILLRSVERVRKTSRVEFVCGQRAVRRARRDFEALTRIASSLSAAVDDAASVVATQSDRLKDAENARKKLEKEVAGARARDRYEAATPNASGVRVMVVRDASSIDELRTLAQAALSLPKAVVVGALASPPSLFVAASEDSGLDAGKLIKEQLTAVGGRGGGSPRIAQGSVPEASQVDDALSSLLKSIG